MKYRSGRVHVASLVGLAILGLVLVAITERQGLSLEPIPPSAASHGGALSRNRYNVPLAAVLATLYAFAIFVVVRIDIKHYLFKRSR